jgi:hypothetical protein
MKVQTINRRIALLFLYPRYWKAVGGKRHVPATLTLEKSLGAPCTRGWVFLGTGLNGCGKLRRHRVRTPDRPGRNDYSISASQLRLHILSMYVSATRQAPTAEGISVFFEGLRGWNVYRFYMEDQFLPHTEQTPSLLQRPIINTV